MLISELITARFNEKAFGNKLPEDLKITWNVHLKTTAGLTYYERRLVSGEDIPRQRFVTEAFLCILSEA